MFLYGKAFLACLVFTSYFSLSTSGLQVLVKSCADVCVCPIRCKELLFKNFKVITD